ncbi:hypothetical protein [Sinorhizobium sp. RAC02]|uniref:DoxX family protein n=1 Tax=Sinorhizobium sp. RAC02 TaxID=1842534 RepID=UPI0008562F6B|nr:hypothetical protein [Sinorhizobium sp. RAC02]AOF93209.1 hypothetical protein BSY16_4633 [Sinorhizobium sp. RAC02]
MVEHRRDVRGSALIVVHNLSHKSDFVANDLVVAAIEKVSGRRIDLRAAKRVLEQRIAYDGKNLSVGDADARSGLPAFGITGVLNIVWPARLLRTTPGWVPAPGLVIFGTGVCEIASAVGLLILSLRRAAGFGLALYAVCVFPANIKHALDTLLGEPSILQWCTTSAVCRFNR